MYHKFNGVKYLENEFFQSIKLFYKKSQVITTIVLPAKKKLMILF